MRRFLTFLLPVLVGLAPVSAEPVSVELILDCSGSMWNRLTDGRFRIDAAKEVLSEFIATAPEKDDLHIGLRLYGSKVSHREPGACEDTALVVPIDGFKRTEMLRIVKETRAVGATPLALSLEAAAADFTHPGKKQIIVFTDGEESCGGDVAAALARLKADGFDADVRIIGIGLPKSVADRFAVLAPVENANSAVKLAEALKTATATTIAAAPAPVVMKEKVTVRVTKNGSPLTDGEISFLGSDQVAIPLTKSETPGEWKAEMIAGLYSAKVASAGRSFTHLAVARGIETVFVLDVSDLPKVTVEVPQEGVTVLAETTALFSGADGREDQYLIIAPVGAPESAEPDYEWAKGKNGQVVFKAPALLGTYEARFAVKGSEYQPVICGRSKPFEVKQPEIVMDIPATVPASLPMQIKVKAPIQREDWMGWVKAGAEDGDYVLYTRLSSDTDTYELNAPAEPGDYELRYAKDGSPQVFARKPFKVEASKLSVEALGETMAGTKVKITWQGPRVKNLYFTIVEKGAEPSAYNDYVRLDDAENPLLLQSPRKAVPSEIRIVDERENKVLLARPLLLTEMKASVEGPAEVAASEPLQVKWTGPQGSGDYVTIVKAGAGNGEYLDYITVIGEAESVKITAPPEAGNYELRYMTQDLQVLARQAIRVK